MRPFDPTELKIDADRAAVVVIDCQERLVRAMDPEGWKRAEKAILDLLHLAKLYEVPVIATEQYPQGLGPTVPSIREALGPVTPLTKVEFSACGAPGFVETLRDREVERGHAVIVTGMEAHVCVYQTVLDLLQLGFRAFVPRDAVVSRAAENKDVGLELMAAAGAVPTSAETVIFQLLGKAGTAPFKEMSRRLK